MIEQRQLTVQESELTESERGKIAIETYQKELIEILNPSLNDSLLPYLETENAITSGNRQAIESRTSNLDKLNELFKFLKVKDKGCQALIDFLKSEKQYGMAEKLQIAKSGTQAGKF